MSTYTRKGFTPANETSSINWKIVVRFGVVALLMPLIPFVAAGRLDWWQMWLYTLLTIPLSIASRYILLRKNPDLFVERSRFTQGAGIKSWDKVIVMFIAIVGPLIVMVIAGLDKRYAWSSEVALWLEIAAGAVILLGYLFSLWAMMVNPFFSSVVRIQADRGQTAISAGPYRFVRHPGYIGGIVAWAVTPIMFGTLWAFIPVMLVLALYVLRTALEDRTLQAELPGYTEYTQRTHYRLLPGIW